MANKFTKSVLERQEKEYKATCQEETSLPELKMEKAMSDSNLLPEVIEEATKRIPESKQINEKINFFLEQKTPINLDAFIIREEGRHAKNKTFYLDVSVINAIKQASLSQKVTESKLVNDILKKILNSSSY